MTFTQHVERPKIKNSCHHHQVNFSYLWVVVVVSSCGSINIKILFVWKKNKRYVFVLQITCCMSDIKKKQRINFYYTPPSPPEKHFKTQNWERERESIFQFNFGGFSIMHNNTFFFWIRFVLSYFPSFFELLYFFLSLIVNMFNGFFLFVVNAACLGLGRLWFYFWTFFFAFLFQCSVDNDALFFFKHLCCCTSSCFTSCCCCLISLFFFILVLDFWYFVFLE